MLWQVEMPRPKRQEIEAPEADSSTLVHGDDGVRLLADGGAELVADRIKRDAWHAKGPPELRVAQAVPPLRAHGSFFHPFFGREADGSFFCIHSTFRFVKQIDYVSGDRSLLWVQIHELYPHFCAYSYLFQQSVRLV